LGVGKHAVASRGFLATAGLLSVLYAIEELVCLYCRPLVHLFGHAHHGAKTQLIDGVLFSNAAHGPDRRHEAVVIDVCLPSLHHSHIDHHDSGLTSPIINPCSDMTS